MTALNLKQKFVIVGNVIMIGRVKSHRDLHVAPLSGGLWFWDQVKNVLYLYGTSIDFGQATQKQVDHAIITKPQFKYTRVVFEPNKDLELVDILAKDMNVRRACELIEANDYL